MATGTDRPEKTQWGLDNPCPAGPSEDYSVPPVDHDTIRPGYKCPGCGEVVTPPGEAGPA